MALDGGSIKEAISTPELFCAWRPGRKSSGEPWNEIVSDWFQQKKTIKVFLIGPFKLALEQVNVRRVWRVCGFSLQQQQHFISPHNVQEIKIYNNSTDDDRGAGCPK